MSGSKYAYRLEPARAGDAPLLAAMSEAHVEAGLKPAWGAARIRWHVRDAESVVLTARLQAMIAGFAISIARQESGCSSTYRWDHRVY